MRTTVTLDEGLIKELMNYSRAKTKTEAVALAVKEQIRKIKLKLLASQLGSIAVDDEAIANSNRANLKREKLLKQLGDDSDSE